MEHPDAGLVRAARTTAAQKRQAVREVLGFDKQLAESRVGDVVLLRAQHHFRVARHLDLSSPVAVVRHREASHLRIVLRRHDDVELCFDAVVGPPEHDLVRRECGEILVRLATRRLIGRGPLGARPHVAQVERLADRIRCPIVPPAGDGEIAPPTRATACVGQDGDVRTIGEKLRVRIVGMGRAKTPLCRGLRRPRGAGLFGRPRRRRRRFAWHALLQQELGRLNARVGVKPIDHHVAKQRVRHRHQKHALVVRHERPHHDAAVRGRCLFIRPLARAVVDGVVEPEATLGAGTRQTPEVLERVGGLERQRQCGGIRRDHEVVSQSPLQTQTGDTERLVLVRVVPIDHAVRRF